MLQRVSWILIIAVLVLIAWTTYRNVFADDAAVRAQAEKLAREKIGCTDCPLTRTEGSRGILSDTLSYTFSTKGSIVVTCRRAYIAFGDYGCTATKP